MPATRAGLILLSSPELLRSPPLMTGATELWNQQSGIRPRGVMPGRLLRLAGATVASHTVAKTTQSAFLESEEQPGRRSP